MFLLMHKRQRSLHELFNDALRTSDSLAFGEGYVRQGTRNALGVVTSSYFWYGAAAKPSNQARVCFQSPTELRFPSSPCQ
jgi:hypothetical protein